MVNLQNQFSSFPGENFRVYFEDGLYFAENDTLLLYGTGASPEEAMTDLEFHIIHFYQYYCKLDWSQVTGDAVRLKRLYENLLFEE